MKNRKIMSELPPLTRWLVCKIFQDDSESKLGDFIEVYNSRIHEKGKSSAWFWFWGYLLKSIPRYTRDSMIHSGALIKTNFLITVRNLRRNRLTSTVNLLGLAVGMACFVLIAIWIHDELNYDNFHENKENLYLLTIKHQNGVLDRNTPYALAPLLADQYPEITGFSRVYEFGDMVQSFFKYQPKSGPPIVFNENNINLVDQHFFTMFSFPFIKGSSENALVAPNSVVLSEKTAGKYFGNTNPLGKVIILNNDRNLTVTGVIRVPPNSHLQLDFVIPLQSRLDSNWNWRDPSYIMLSQETPITEFRQKISGFMNKKMPYPSTLSFELNLMPLVQVRLGFGRKTFVTVFSIIALFILLIACINYANLATARYASRAREVGLKKVMGANRSQLIQQFLAESVLISLFSFLLSIVLGNVFLPLLNNLTEKQLVFTPFQSLSNILLLGSLIIAVGVLAGIYPAFFMTRRSFMSSLKSSSKNTGEPSRFRIFSVVGQFTISVLLIICTTVIFLQMNFIKNRPLGFSTEHIIKLPLNRRLLLGFAHYKNTLLENPNIINVTAGQTVPYNEDLKTGSIDWPRKDPNFSAHVRYTISHFDYLETFGMQLVAGRSFRKGSTADTKNYIINEKAADYMGMKDPVGKRIFFWKTEGTIIGVVKNYHHVPLHRKIMPHIFTINPRSWNALKHIFVKLAPQNISETLKFIESKTTALAPEHPFSYTFLDQGIKELYQSEQKLGRLISYFAFLAIFISCLGMFALATFTAQQRTKEIGVRKVLGSPLISIVSLLSKKFLQWVILANVLAWPIGYFVMHKWLQGFAYRTTINPAVFILAASLSLMVAAIPVVSQSIKAANTNPIDALKYD